MLVAWIALLLWEACAAQQGVHKATELSQQEFKDAAGVHVVYGSSDTSPKEDPYHPTPYTPTPYPTKPGTPSYPEFTPSCECKPLIACAADFPLFPAKPCSIEGAPGVCCPPKPYSKGKIQPLFPAPHPDDVTIEQDISQELIEESSKHSLWQIHERDILQKDLLDRKIHLTDVNSPASRHARFFKTNPLSRAISRTAVTIEEATLFLKNMFYLDGQKAGFGLKKFNIQNTLLADSCPARPTCVDEDKIYRTADGSCNNLAQPQWGTSNRPFRRMFLPSYEDGVRSPRGHGRNLPSARLVSSNNVEDVDVPDPDLSLSVMQFGQFVDHDLAHAPVFRLDDMDISCCTDNGQLRNRADLADECLPISIPQNDPFYSSHNQRCMNFVRSQRAPNENCTLGFSETMNSLTHFLDGSMIYGSERETTADLRENRGGLFKVQGFALLPPDESAEETQCDIDGVRPCFLAGEDRVNEQVSLTAMHTLWMREHNRLALYLTKLNPQWNDETLFQEARKITIATLQHIVYNEWLPIVLGRDFMSANSLSPLPSGFSSDYDQTLNPGISNEFATVAFRFGHTLVQGMIKIFGKDHKNTETVKLQKTFFNPVILYTPGKLDEFLRGLMIQPMQKWDNHISSELTNRLFQSDGLFGMDLISLNIQRGRDHGIPAYNDLREGCGLPRARDFSDLLFDRIIDQKVVDGFVRTYASVDDIDPFVGGLSEHSVPGGLLGPTFRCIVGEQFIRLKRGDRFFYEHGNQPSSFTLAQLDEIRKTSFARLLCDNGYHIQHVTPLSFRSESYRNPKVSCDSPAVPRLQLGPWKVSKGYEW